MLSSFYVRGRVVAAGPDRSGPVGRRRTRTRPRSDGRRPAGIPEQRVEAPGDVIGFHAAELLVDDRHQRGGAQHQQHEHLERQRGSHHPAEKPVAAPQRRVIIATAGTVDHRTD